MKNKVAIIGFGYVGRAMHKIFPDALIYDIAFENNNGDGLLPDAPKFARMPDEINAECDLAIVCVPTPMQDDPTMEFQKVDLTIIEDVIGWLQTPLILIKSTVPPGTVERLSAKWPKKRIVFSAEYVGEGKYHISPWKYMSPTDPTLHEFQIFGGRKEDCEAVANHFIKRLGPEKTYYIVDSIEAEIIKYAENSWGAMKVIWAQEFYDLCQKMGASWIRVREGWALDNRVEKMHTAVFVDDRGFAGKCYPKDINGIVSAADEVGVDMSLLKAVLRKNKEYQKDKDLTIP
ncbi:MAG: hypothetical protein U1E54_03815 [Candidatus Levybacteria bacterium]|nr:hypothetical protein [Candidatus Levybacteria bacterium]